jgi:hypothetical protein
MDFLQMFSFMLKDRYPIFCSVFQTAAEYNFEEDRPDFMEEYQQFETNNPDVETTDLFTHSFDERFESFNPEIETRSFNTQECDSVHDLDKINELLERMVISATENMPSTT